MGRGHGRRCRREPPFLAAGQLHQPQHQVRLAHRQPQPDNRRRADEDVLLLPHRGITSCDDHVPGSHGLLLRRADVQIGTRTMATAVTGNTWMISRATHLARPKWPWGAFLTMGVITDLDHILSKIMAYETRQQSDISWRANVLLPMKPSDGSTPGYQLGEEIKNDILVPNGWTYHRVYDVHNYGPESRSRRPRPVQSTTSRTPGTAPISALSSGGRTDRRHPPHTSWTCRMLPRWMTTIRVSPSRVRVVTDGRRPATTWGTPSSRTAASLPSAPPGSPGTSQGKRSFAGTADELRHDL